MYKINLCDSDKFDLKQLFLKLKNLGYVFYNNEICELEWLNFSFIILTEKKEIWGDVFNENFENIQAKEISIDAVLSGVCRFF